MTLRAAQSGHEPYSADSSRSPPRDAAGAGALNRLLAALPPAELAELQPHLERQHVDQRQVLFEPDSPVSVIHFPETCIVSLVTTMQVGGTVETGTVGREGCAGLPVVLGDGTSSVRAIVRLPGTSLTLRAARLAEVARPGSALQRLLLRYAQAFMAQVTQTAACNSAHLVVQRCARWLLATAERIDGDDLPLTHEFLAFMLGVRRSGVTIAMHALKERELIRYARGRVTIVDRAQLERASCECYRVVRAHFDRLLPSGFEPRR